MRLTPEDAKIEIIGTCTAMIDGKLNLIKGCRKLALLRRDIGATEDEMFHPFIAVDSETDHFPLGEMRKQCSQSYLRKSDSEMDAYFEGASQEIIDACKKLIKNINR